MRRFAGSRGSRRLLDALVERAEELCFEFLLLWPATRAVPFYRRAGFRPVADAHDRTDALPPMSLTLGSESTT